MAKIISYRISVHQHYQAHYTESVFLNLLHHYIISKAHSTESMEPYILVHQCFKFSASI